jgi:hypothetical protein
MNEPEIVTPEQYSTEQRREEHPPSPASPVSVSRHGTRGPSGRRSMFWPIALIAFGALLLLSNLGMFPATGWAILWRFWPIAVIALGIDVLIGRRSVAGALASGVLTLVLVGVAIGIALFAEQIPYLVDLAKPAALQYDHIEHPLDGIETALVTIDWTSAPGYLSALDDSGNILEADIAYRGDLAFDVDTSGSEAVITLDTFLQGISYGSLDFGDDRLRWDVQLSPEADLDLRLDAGSGAGTYDLRDLSISHLNLDVGSGAVDLTMPAESSFRGDVDGGSGALTIHLPTGVGLRIELESGSGSFSPDGRLELVSGERDGDGTWETDGYDSADYRIEIAIDQGSGSLRVDD